VDLDWNYRAYSVSTGWTILSAPTAQTSKPGKQDFPSKTVDFSVFIKP